MKIIIHTEYELPNNEFERLEWLNWWTENNCPLPCRADFKKNGWAKLENKDPTSETKGITTYHLKRDDDL
jgi:hypothetical protein